MKSERGLAADTLEAQEEKKNVRFYRALFRAGLVEGTILGEHGGPTEPTRDDLEEARRGLEALTRDYPDHAQFPFFLATVLARLDRPEEAVRATLQDAVARPKFKTNQSKVARALGYRGLQSTSRAVLGSFIKDFLPSPDFNRGLQTLVDRFPAGSDGFAGSALQLGEQVMRNNRTYLERTQVPIAGMRREYDFGRWLAESAWRRLHPEDGALASTPPELRELMKDPFDHRRGPLWNDLISRIERAPAGECPREELDRLVSQERRELEALHGPATTR
jgi:hypothetical protein